MRYLVVIPPADASGGATFHDVDADDIAPGDELLVDELLLRVHDVVDVPTDDGYDATLVCTACG